MWSLGALEAKLPIMFPVKGDPPPSSKPRYRSDYRYIGYADLRDLTLLPILSDFEIAQRLIDFSPLEAEIARIYKPSAKGQVPFHPVSMLLAVCLRREQDYSWCKLAKILAGEHGAGWRRLFGFHDGDTPSASGLRYFNRQLPPGLIADLCPRCIDLLRQHGLFPERSTYPGDSPDRGVSVIQDGMLHQARNQQCCHRATDSCQEPLPVLDAQDTANPNETISPPLGQRPCHAREKGLPGCQCNTPDCQTQCELASTLDPCARFIHYSGNNRKHGSTKGETTPQSRSGAEEPSQAKGKNVFGYRSVGDRILDDRFWAAWTARSDLYPANTDERTIFVARMDAMQARFPDLSIGEIIADSANGYDESLTKVYDMGALRMIDIRGHKTDEHWETCVSRGYDDKGRPLCPHGYPLRSNGYDYQRHRAKYVCSQVCHREPLKKDQPVQPVEGCPHRESRESAGFVVNVGRTMPDGSTRLARDIPYGSATWNARYGRRNMAEGRNAQLEQMGLKRMQSYGLKDNDSNTKDVQIADFVINLRTLGRLVREATNKQLG
jgi:hypothetical protein